MQLRKVICKKYKGDKCYNVCFNGKYMIRRDLGFRLYIIRFRISSQEDAVVLPHQFHNKLPRDSINIRYYMELFTI